MKDEQKTAAAAKAGKGKNRTVKVSDKIHHKLRVLAVQRRMPMQHFIEKLIIAGLDGKLYEEFASEKAAAA